MLRIGLTGGIACGKSTVAEMLVERGAHFLPADSLAHKLYLPGTPTYAEIVRHFGETVLNNDRTINRRSLANLAFPDRIGELNAIVHPAVVEAQNRWMNRVEAEDPNGIAVVEAALLIEAGVAGDFDKIIVVVCGQQDKIARFATRMGIALDTAKAEVTRRSAAQLSDEEKARRADYVIENSGPRENTERQVEKIWEQLQSLARASSGSQ